MAGKGTDFHEHPHYSRSKDKWQKWLDLYEGDHDTLVQAKYLVMHELEHHPVEGAKLRRLREQRSWYLNLTEPVVSVFAGLFFREDPNVDQVKELFGEAFDDVDGEGNSFVSFLKGPVLTHYLRDGLARVYTDGLEFDGETKADEAGHRAYFTIVPALAAKDWKESPNKAGDYTLFRYEFTEVKDRADLTEKPVEVVKTKVLRLQGGSFTITEYQKSSNRAARATWEQVGPVVTVNLPFLPIAEARGESWIKDVAEQQLQLFNHTSAWNNQLNHQAFQRPVFSGHLDTDQKKAWSEFSAMVVPPGTEVTVIEPADMTALENAIEKDINWLFKVAFNQTQSLAANTKAVASDDTIRELKDDLFALIESSIQDLENIANQMVRHYAAFMGKPDFAGKVTLSREITEEDIEKQMEILAALRAEIMQVLPWRKAVLKKFLHKQNLPEKETKEISDEIDKLKPVEPVQMTLPLGLSAVRRDGGQTDAEPDRAGSRPPGPADRVAG
jgi:hypothetical protein